jgi:Ser/Thr protein kinase RdoA (MazF antagonist)
LIEGELVCTVKDAEMPNSTSFFELPIEQQVAIATQAGRAALAAYDVPSDVTLDILKHRENTVFALLDPRGRKHGALRVHVPGYQTRASILSEFQWMRALESAGVRTPGIVAARDGSLVIAVTVGDTGETRLVDVLEWIEGSQPGGDELVTAFRTLGELQARCHNHAAHWQVPTGFTRQRWDDTTLLTGDHPTVAPAWDNWALSAEQRTVVLSCRDALRERLTRWGKGREHYGIIHSDLMPDNLIIASDGVRLIDFDDAGFGWYLYDPASALLPYYGSDLYDALMDPWLAGYRSERPLSDEELAELPTFLLLRCFYALGWLHLRRNSDWAAAFIDPVVGWTMQLGAALLHHT